MRTALLMCFVFFSVGTALEAKTIHVSKAGNAGSTCTTANEASPCTGGSCALRTINAGIACLSGGDTLIVHDGVYAEHITDTSCNPGHTCASPPAGSESSYTTIKAANIHGATLQTTINGGSNSGLVNLDNPNTRYISIEGFRLDGNMRTHGAGGMSTCIGSYQYNGVVGTHHLRFRDVECFDGETGVGGIVRDMELERFWAHGYGKSWCDLGDSEGVCHGMYLSMNRDPNDPQPRSTITIKDSHFWNNDGYGLQIYDAESVTIINSTFYDNLIGGIALGASNSNIYNNVFYNNAPTGGNVVRALFQDGGTATFNHNIVANHFVYSAVHAYGATLTLTNNLFVGSFGEGVLVGPSIDPARMAGNICSQAQSNCTTAAGDNSTFFVDAGAANFRPTSTSPVRNAGVTLSAPYLVDADGVARVAPPDVGAYEFGTAGGLVASSLNWVTQPGTALAGAVLPTMRVEILDQNGARFATTGTVSLALGSNPGAATLTGTTAVNAVAGLATFSNVVVSTAGVNYTLVASFSGLANKPSTAFTISGAPLAVPGALSSMQQTVTATGAIRLGWDYTASSTPATGFKVYQQTACTGAFTALPQMPMPRTFTTGVNLSGAEVNPTILPGTHGTDYLYPDYTVGGGYAGVGYFLGKDMTSLRLPFRWERLQPTRNAALDSAELYRLTTTVGNITGFALRAILTLDNFGRYTVGGTAHLVGSATVPAPDFADVWSRIATAFLDNPNVEFDLMAKPHTMTTEAIVTYSQAAINAIRATGSTHRITVQGNNWSYPHTWATTGLYGTANSAALLGLTDSAANLVFGVNLYLDDLIAPPPIGEGECLSTTIGPERLAPFTAWLRTNGKKGSMSEVGGPATATCLTAVQNVLAYVRDNSDVYAGWSGWAGGPLWATSYPLDLEPAVGTAPDRAQMDVMEPFITEHAARAQTYTVSGLAPGSCTRWRVTATTAGEESAPSLPLEWIVPPSDPVDPDVPVSRPQQTRGMLLMR